jgi:small subunit ribosomal protein S20
MANHKSAEKAHRQSLKRAARNRAIKSRVKTFITHFKSALHSQNIETATITFKKAESELMKSVSKGVYHLNTAARKVARLCKMLKQLEVAKSPTS